MFDLLFADDGFIKLTASETISDHKIVTNDFTLRQIDVGVLELKCNHSTSTSLVLSAGIHGNETAPIEIISKSVADIVSGRLTPTIHVLFVIGNPRAMVEGKRFIEVNLNRLFGKPSKVAPETSYEVNRASELERVTSGFFSGADSANKVHFDLHTAIRGSKHKTFAVKPFDNQCGNTHSLVDMGIDALLHQHQPAATYSQYTAKQFAANAFTVELGKARPFGKNQLEDFRTAADYLKALIAGKSLDGGGAKALIEYQVVAEILKLTEDFELFVDADAMNFQSFLKGDVIAADQNYQYKVDQNGEAIVFPNPQVPVGQRAALMVRPIQ